MIDAVEFDHNSSGVSVVRGLLSVVTNLFKNWEGGVSSRQQFQLGTKELRSQRSEVGGQTTENRKKKRARLAEERSRIRVADS
jgi:hypothetical protein